MSEQDFLFLPHSSFSVLILSFISPTIFSLITFFFLFFFPLFYFYFYFVFLSSFFFLLPSLFLFFSFFPTVNVTSSVGLATFFLFIAQVFISNQKLNYPFLHMILIYTVYFNYYFFIFFTVFKIFLFYFLYLLIFHFRFLFLFLSIFFIFRYSSGRHLLRFLLY